MNGQRHWQSFYKMDRSEVAGWMDMYRTHSGKEFQTQLKTDFSDNPSIQGMWNSYTNAEPEEATAVYPEVNLKRMNASFISPHVPFFFFFQSDFSKPVYMPQTATEKLLQLFKEQQQLGNSSSSSSSRNSTGSQDVEEAGNASRKENQESQ